MLNAFLSAATSLVSKQVTSVENVDRAWMGVMKTNIGPFGILDLVGLKTAYDINQYWADKLHDPGLQANAAFLKSYVDKGWLGVNSGRGFYSYSHPEYAASGFLDSGVYLTGLTAQLTDSASSSPLYSPRLANPFIWAR